MHVSHNGKYLLNIFTDCQHLLFLRPTGNRLVEGKVEARALEGSKRAHTGAMIHLQWSISTVLITKI